MKYWFIYNEELFEGFGHWFTVQFPSSHNMVNVSVTQLLADVKYRKWLIERGTRELEREAKPLLKWGVATFGRRGKRWRFDVSSDDEGSTELVFGFRDVADAVTFKLHHGPLVATSE